MVSVFYREEQAVKVNSFSNSPNKPKSVVSNWRAVFGDSVEVKSFEPVNREHLKAVHLSSYVDGVLGGYLPNGFGTKSPKVTRSLMYTSGSMLAASEEALVKGIAVSPTSGFHHAGYEYGGGFCTFNGLMVSAVDLLDRGLVKKVGILDADMHFGDGTAEIIKILGVCVKQVSFGALYHEPSQANKFFKKLPGVLSSFSDCDLVLYQAGADPYIHDPLGGWLTVDQMRLRDHTVFEFFAESGIPLAWNLAGGYSTEEMVVDIHTNTMKECLDVYGR